MSDDFIVKDETNRKYTLRVWGVNLRKSTKHCMSLIFDNVEIETFHLDSLNTALEPYHINRIYTRDGWKKFNRQTLIRYSTQLQMEGKGVIKSGTQSLINMMKRRKNGN